MLFFCLLAQTHEKWIEDLAGQPLDPQMLELVQKLSNNKECCGSAVVEGSEKGVRRHEVPALTPNKSGVTSGMTEKLYIFMSYSVPKQVWQDLWAQVGKHPFQFVLRGLPSNSFQELALKVQDYNCPVIIDPNLFKKYNITQVPAFVLVTGNTHKGAYGNVSLDHALQHLGR